MANHPSNKVTHENVADVMTYHAPQPGQVERHAAIAAAACVFVDAILRNAPDCADRSSAIRALREAKMWASAAIALESHET